MSGIAVGPRGALVALLAAGTLASSPVSAGVGVALSPAAQQVAPGAEFDLTFEIAPGGSAFNAFEARVEFDPAALTPVPLVPVSSQVGAIFTAACPNLFHRFSAGASQDTAACSLLCAGQSTAGPGTLYRLRFRAGTTPRQTTLAFDQIRFYQAGLFVLPVSSSPAGVGIGMPPPTTEAVPPTGAEPALRAGPSPARDRVRFACVTARVSRARLEVLDLQGRLVRRLLDETRPAGAWTAEWDARDARGARVPAGAYLAVLTAGDVRVARRMVVIP